MQNTQRYNPIGDARLLVCRKGEEAIRPARGLGNRIMREVGPMSDRTPAYPTAGRALAPLKAKAEAAGSSDFSLLWAGQAASLGREIGSGDLTRQLAADAEQRLKVLGSTG